MCISAGLAAISSFAATAAPMLSAVGAVQKIIAGRGSSAPAMTAPSPADQQAASDAKATQSANARLAARKRALSANALATGGGDVMSDGILGGGRPTLGG